MGAGILWWQVSDEVSLVRKASPCHDVTMLQYPAYFPLKWFHNWRDGVSNHEPHDCLLNRIFGCETKKTSKLRVTGLCGGNSPVTWEFPTQMASNAGNVSIWWSRYPLEIISLKARIPMCSCIRPDSSICVKRIHYPQYIKIKWFINECYSPWLLSWPHHKKATALQFNIFHWK